ncbi:MAG: alpha/beta hydrolase [Phycicoccus sp.]|nr:alpha/beta hydrolase [Phycicoccus sp.]NMM35829.1 alpha/beta hydrolase [Phycicoccus sp.]
MDRLPVVYVRGYAGATSGIDSQVDDPFYGFNLGATHVRVGGDGDPMFYQFEGPMLRLMTDENYRLIVRGDQQQYLNEAEDGTVPPESLWVYRFYDQAATTFVPQPHEGMVERFFSGIRKHITADGFDIETAAAGLYDLIMTIRAKTGADKVLVVAHSMGGLVVRCMMQKICFEGNRVPAKSIVAKFFTYGTPHGGISFDIGALDWAQQAFGPAGADIFAPPKMFGYLTPGKKFGDLPGRGDQWDPQFVDEKVFSAANIFCLIGTDPKDYGLSRVVVGPKSDGLVRIEHAYVRGANRAYVYKSHSGTYGEVNSEEGYQNLRRFMFGRWAVSVKLGGLPAYPKDMAQRPPEDQWPTWQADMSLAIRGISVVISEQQAAHWCPIQINEELRQHVDSPDDPVTLASTFLLDPGHLLELARERGDADPLPRHGGRLRYVLSLSVSKLVERGGFFSFGEHLEKVSDWSDSLIVDVGPNDAGTGLQAWAAWNSQVGGPNDELDPITEGLPAGQRDPISFDTTGGMRSCDIALPTVAQALSILGPLAHITLQVTDRTTTDSTSTAAAVSG